MPGIDLSHIQRKHLTESKINKKDQHTLTSILNTEIKVFEKVFGNKEKESFYSELGLLLSTGVDIQKSFLIILEDIKIKSHKILLESILNDIISGESMYETLKSRGKIFTKYEIESIKIGEESGRLPQVLIELGMFYKGVIKLKRQIIGVLTYPAVVISLSIMIVYFMLSYVVPVFKDVFTQTGNQLPEITIFLVNLSEKSDLIFLSITVFISILIITHKVFKNNNSYRDITSKITLKVPLINQLISKIYLARFCQTMKLLMTSKVVVNEALDLVSNMISFFPIEKALTELKKDIVEKGLMLNESLNKHSIFPSKLVALIKLSEEVNEPEIIYNKLFEQYTNEIEHQQAILGKLIEPVFIVVLGLFVGFILIAMYLPMFEMSSGNF